MTAWKPAPGRGRTCPPGSRTVSAPRRRSSCSCFSSAISNSGQDHLTSARPFTFLQRNYLTKLRLKPTSLTKPPSSINMVSRRWAMLTVKDILTGKITLDSECIDRVYLNGYGPHLQMPGGLIRFIREQLGFPIPSPMLLPPVTQAFRKAVEQYAQEQGLAIVDFGKAKDEDKDDLARAHLAQFAKKQGVVLIGKAQEKALGYKAQKSLKGSRVWFEYSRQSLYVTYYYFYILDADFG